MEQSHRESSERLRAKMDRLFDEFTPGLPWDHGRRRRRGMGMMEPFGAMGAMMEPCRGTPFGWSGGMGAVDAVDKDNEVKIRAELSGMDEKDIAAGLSNNVLTTQGEKKEEK